MWKLLVKFIHSASNLVDGGIFNALFCENLLINCWKNCENRNGKQERNKSTLVSLFARQNIKRTFLCKRMHICTVYASLPSSLTVELNFSLAQHQQPAPHRHSTPTLQINYVCTAHKSHSKCSSLARCDTWHLVRKLWCMHYSLLSSLFIYRTVRKRTHTHTSAVHFGTRSILTSL